MAGICTTVKVNNAWVNVICGHESENLRGNWVNKVLRALFEAFFLLLSRPFLVKEASSERDDFLIWTSPWGAVAALTKRLLLAVEPYTDNIMLGN